MRIPPYSYGVFRGYNNGNIGLKWQNVLRNRREILLPLLTKFKKINQFLLPLKSSKL